MQLSSKHAYWYQPFDRRKVASVQIDSKEVQIRLHQSDVVFISMRPVLLQDAAFRVTWLISANANSALRCRFFPLSEHSAGFTGTELQMISLFTTEVLSSTSLLSLLSCELSIRAASDNI
jgi:hypothetical protein